MIFEEFNPVSLDGPSHNILDFAISAGQRIGFQFETVASDPGAQWDDVAPTSGRFEIASDDWFNPGGGKGDDTSGPLFGAEGGGSTGSSYPLPPVDSQGREMTDEEIEYIISVYNNANSSGGSGSGGGGGSTGSTTQSLGPDLTIYDCEHLANLESQIRSNMQAARNVALSLLAFSSPFQGEQVFDEIWTVFETLNDQGLYDPDDPLGTMSRVAGRTIEAGDLIDLSSFGIAMNVTVSTYQLFMVQSAFAYKLNLDRIDAEQARRGGGCGG